MTSPTEREAAALDAWQPIETAPKDFTAILAYAVGLDGRPMLEIVRWADTATMFSSACPRMDFTAETCDWCGVMGTRYGVPFTHWQPLPAPPVRENTQPPAEPDQDTRDMQAIVAAWFGQDWVDAMHRYEVSCERILAALATIKARVRDEEREAVCKWLRKRRATPMAKSHRDLAAHWAEAIARGEHRDTRT